MKTSDCTDESRKDETCLYFKMKKHIIKTRKISQNKHEMDATTTGYDLMYIYHQKLQRKYFCLCDYVSLI